MKKKLLLCITLAIVILSCVVFVKNNKTIMRIMNENNPEYVSFVENVIDKRWYIDIWGCREYMVFFKDKAFESKEECGKPLTEYNYYKQWEFDAKTKTITLSLILHNYTYHEDVPYENCNICPKSYTTMEFVSCDGKTLVVRINDKEITFTSIPEPVNENDYLNRHPNNKDIINRNSVFSTYVEGNNWIQDDDTQNELVITYDPGNTNTKFKYVTSSGEPVEGFGEFDYSMYSAATSQITLYNSSSGEKKTIPFIDYYNKTSTMVLEIDGEEITFKKK